MPDSLLTWPLRASLHGVEAALRATRDLADLGLVAVELADRLLGNREPRGDFTAPASRPPQPRRPPRPAPVSDPGRNRFNGVATPPAEPVADAVADAVDLDTLAGIDHLDEEPELVAEFSEPGAQDGAGASIHFAAPFDGYETLRAADVVARLQGSDAATLGAVELYEGSHRRRRTVLDAVARELRRRD
jgi:hypothetical protein